MEPQVPQRIELTGSRRIKCFLLRPAPGSSEHLVLFCMMDTVSVPQDCSTNDVLPEVPTGIYIVKDKPGREFSSDRFNFSAFYFPHRNRVIVG